MSVFDMILYIDEAHVVNEYHVFVMNVSSVMYDVKILINK